MFVWFETIVIAKRLYKRGLEKIIVIVNLECLLILDDDQTNTLLKWILKNTRTGAKAVSRAYYGTDSSIIIFLDDVNCTGEESHIAQCTHIGDWGVHNCGHNEDAGVNCTFGKFASGDPVLKHLDWVSIVSPSTPILACISKSRMIEDSG